jgi:hypothetical protein
MSRYIPGISTPLDIPGISMDIHGYPRDIDQDCIYMGYTYSMYIHEIGVPDVILSTSEPESRFQVADDTVGSTHSPMIAPPVLP